MKYMIEVIDNLENTRTATNEKFSHTEPANSIFVYTLIGDKEVCLSVIQCPVLEEIPKNSVIKITRI